MLSSVTFTSPVSGSSALTLHETSNRKLSKANGLFGPPAPRDNNRIAPTRDGSIDQTQWLSERTIILEGELWNTTQAAVLADFQTLSAAFSDTMFAAGTLKFTRPDSTEYQCAVKISDAVQVSLEGGSTTLAYQVTFRAQDPRVYSTTLNSLTLATTPVTGPSGGIYTLGATTVANIVNNGKVPTPISVTITPPSGGPLSSGTLVQVNTASAYTSLAPAGSAQILVLGTGITAATSVVYDTGSRTRTPSDSVVSNGALTSTTEWPLLYPGTNTVTWTAKSTATMASNKPSCVITWRDAWL